MENSLPVSELPVLEYPRDLYVGEFAYRSRLAVLAGIGSALAAIPFAYVPTTIAGPWWGRLLFISGAILFGLVSLRILIGIFNDSRDVYKLTTTGIETRGKLVPWSKIRQVAAMGKESTQSFHQLCYTVQHTGSITSTQQLQSSRGLTTAEYLDLIERLKTELLPSYPKLILGGYAAMSQ